MTTLAALMFPQRSSKGESMMSDGTPKVRIIASIHASGGVLLRAVGSGDDGGIVFDPSSNQRVCLVVGLGTAYAAILAAAINSAATE